MRKAATARDRNNDGVLWCQLKDLLQLEWLAPYGSVEPGSSALSEKSRSDWRIRQLTCLLWAASAPKK